MPQTFVAQRKMEIIAFTICVNFDDILKHMFDQNARFLKKWYIISSPADTQTAELISTAAKDNVELLIYDNFYNGMRFNKGGAQRFAQMHIHKHHPSANVLCIDADIYLPDDFLEKLPPHLEDNTLYGSQRTDYWTLEDFVGNTNPHPKTSAHFQGYFQLYKENTKYLFENSYNCSRCDDIFRDSFPKKVNLDLCVKHLGINGRHWNGRDFRLGVF